MNNLFITCEDFIMIRVASARKHHDCHWCGETISLLASYYNHQLIPRDKHSKVKLHPECFNALTEVRNTQGDPVEIVTGDNNRGCNCEKDPTCTYCYERTL